MNEQIRETGIVRQMMNVELCIRDSSAWFVSLVVALFALMSLSIPRKIVVKKATVEILCLLDMTEIPRMEIASVQRVDPRQMRWVVPLFGGYGFFGYYG